MGKKSEYDEHRSNVNDWKKGVSGVSGVGILKKWVASKSENYGHRRL